MPDNALNIIATNAHVLPLKIRDAPHSVSPVLTNFYEVTPKESKISFFFDPSIIFYFWLRFLIRPWVSWGMMLLPFRSLAPQIVQPK